MGQMFPPFWFMMANPFQNELEYLGSCGPSSFILIIWVVTGVFWIHFPASSYIGEQSEHLVGLKYMKVTNEFRFFLLSSSLCRIWTYQSKTLTVLQSRKLAEAIFTFFLCGSFAEVRFAGICHCVFYISF